MSGASADFRSRVEVVADLLRTTHPHPMVREAFTVERIDVLEAPTAWDRSVVFGSAAPLDGVLLVGLHVGLPGDPLSTHRIRVFEDGVRRAASFQGWSLEDQIQNTLLHEVEHHWGLCPDGHADCSEVERSATLEVIASGIPGEGAPAHG